MAERAANTGEFVEEGGCHFVGKLNGQERGHEPVCRKSEVARLGAEINTDLSYSFLLRDGKVGNGLKCYWVVEIEELRRKELK